MWCSFSCSSLCTCIFTSAVFLDTFVKTICVVVNDELFKRIHRLNLWSKLFIDFANYSLIMIPLVRRTEVSSYDIDSFWSPASISKVFVCRVPPIKLRWISLFCFSLFGTSIIVVNSLCSITPFVVWIASSAPRTFRIFRTTWWTALLGQ